MPGHDKRLIQRKRPDLRNGSRAPDRRRSLGGARQNYERYLVRVREASLAGDVVEMENCHQHAEHYLRVLKAANAGT
jgi:hypothetical protein